MSFFCTFRAPRRSHRVALWLTALLCFWLVLFTSPALARQEFLDPDQAFRLSVRAADSRTIELRYEVAPGYYLYRERFAIEAQPASVRLGEALYPHGKIKFDETFQKDVESFRGTLLVALPVEAGPTSFKIVVTSQGCADKGLCYPPRPQHLQVDLVDGALRSVTLMKEEAGEAWTPPDSPSLSLAPARPLAAAEAADAAPSLNASGSNPVEQALRSGHWWRVAGVFLLAGVLLSFTPCVLPMLPILSSIIVGDTAQEQRTSRWRSLALSLAYSLGMALVYTAMGVAAGLAGEGLAAALQTPWVLAAFASLLVLLSLSMFGLYELQLPSAWQTALSERSRRLKGGRYPGVFLMGGLSALIVGPCVAAPLAGALVYISQTRDVLLGGTALFALALGMSVPLLLLGLSAGSLLPRAGAWMDGVKRTFGIVLLGVAVWMVSPVIPTVAVMLSWGTLAVLTAIFLLRPRDGARVGTDRRAAQVLGLAFLIIGTTEWAGALTGGRDVLRPWAHWRTGTARHAEADLRPFRTIKRIDELDAVLRNAGQPVLLDFYADWCISCKEMERFTFPDARVQAGFAKAVLLRADVTANDAQDKALLRRFGLFGPPGILFFDAQGHELAAARVIGYQSADDFVESLIRGGL
jgi:thioredoxin:protein disulfide reductase